MNEVQAFASVWDALEESPAAAAHMRLRSELMVALQDAIERWRLPVAAAGKRLALSKMRFDQLRRGKISQFELDELLALAGKAGLTIEIRRDAAE